MNAWALASGTLVVVVVVDLSNPGASVDTVLFWLATLREQVTKAAQEVMQKLPVQQQ